MTIFEIGDANYQPAKSAVPHISVVPQCGALCEVTP
jgi:hypothetical protein